MKDINKFSGHGERPAEQPGRELVESEVVPERGNASVFTTAWEKVRHHGLTVALAASITFGAVTKAEARGFNVEAQDGQANSGQTQIKKVRPRPGLESERRVSFEQELQEAKRLYESTKFETSEEATLQLVQALEEITLAPEFKRLQPLEQAELLHRRAYTSLTYNERYYFKDGYHDVDAEDAEVFIGNFREINKSIQEAIQIELAVTGGELTEKRERSVKLLLQSGLVMATSGVKLSVESPALRREYFDSLKTEGAVAAQDAMKVDGRTRHVGNGFFVFSNAKKNQELMPLVGLARYTGDVDRNMAENEVVKIMGGAAYDIEDVVNWANDMRTGKFSALTKVQGAREQAFIDNLVQRGLLKATPGGYTKGNAKHIAYSPPDQEPFTHEAGHIVQFANAAEGGSYLQFARDDFSKLQVSDKKLFRDFMKLQNPKLSEQATMEEFFAYNQQTPDWRKHAKLAVYGSK